MQSPLDLRCDFFLVRQVRCMACKR